MAYICDTLQGKLSSKAPFSQYGALAERGANVVWGSPTDPSSLPSQDFDVVYDNNGKDMEACQPMIDAFKVGSGGQRQHSIDMWAGPPAPQPLWTRFSLLWCTCAPGNGQLPATSSQLVPGSVLPVITCTVICEYAM